MLQKDFIITLISITIIYKHIHTVISEIKLKNMESVLIKFLNLFK